MGKGKGPVTHWCTRVSPGSVIVEIGGKVSAIAAKGALSLIKKKLSFKTKLLTKNQFLISSIIFMGSSKGKTLYFD